METPAAKAYGRVIGKGIGPSLKDGGFKKKRHAFYRQKGPFFQVVNFQASRLSIAEEVRFCINLDTVLPYFHCVFTGREFPSNPCTAAPVRTQRLGRFMPDGLDHWWEVTPNTPPDAFNDRIIPLLQNHGMCRV